MPTAERVIVVPGFAAKSLLMQPLAKNLRRARFDVEIWNYPSVSQSIQVHAARLYQNLQELTSPQVPLHLVAHSMGAIVVRAALEFGTVPNLQRIVLLAPPNHGSPIARLAATVVGKIILPTAELSDASASYVQQLPRSIAVTTGIIAARYDWLVSQRATQLGGVAEHITLPATHNSLLFSRQTARLICNFLRGGSFRTTPVVS